MYICVNLCSLPKNSRISIESLNTISINSFSKFHFPLFILPQSRNCRILNYGNFMFSSVKSAVLIDNRGPYRLASNDPARQQVFEHWFLAVYWLKKPFLSKVKGMNDRGIFPLCALVLP